MHHLKHPLFCLLLSLALCPLANAGREFKQLERTIEEARITIKPTKESSANEALGILTATLLECTGCKPESYTYSINTRLVNQFGAEKPVQEIDSWDGSRAMIRYYTDSGVIKLIKILPPSQE